jgi:hypothetical protein
MLCVNSWEGFENMPAGGAASSCMANYGIMNHAGDATCVDGSQLGRRPGRRSPVHSWLPDTMAHQTTSEPTRRHEGKHSEVAIFATHLRRFNAFER